MNHKRTCHDCGNVAEHESNVAPEVFCRLCGSPDTRPLSAFAAIAGKWPGDETDEEIDAAMDAMNVTKHLRGKVQAMREALDMIATLAADDNDIRFVEIRRLVESVK